MDANYVAIESAIDTIANGTSKKTNGKVTALNVAREAGISKATLYRLFNKYPELNQSFFDLRQNGIQLNADVPLTLYDTLQVLEDEVKTLRTELSKVRRDSESLDKQRLHQIFLLWTSNRQLEEKIGLLMTQAKTLSVISS